MLDILRAKSRSVLIYVLFGIIIVVFVVSFGPGSGPIGDQGPSRASYAARVNGQVVQPSDFDEAYVRLYRMYQQRAGPGFTRELADQIGLRTVAMNQLVERELVLEEARRRGVQVTDDDLNRAIQEIPAFQTGGTFDLELYKRATAASYGSPGKFEELLRRDLAYQKMLALLRDTVQVSEDEVRAAWLADADRVDLLYVRFPLEAAKAEVKVADADVKAFLAANGPRIEKFYQDNPARFEKKKRVRARHVLVRLPEKASAADEDAARKKIEALAGRARKGEDFAKLAQENSDDTGTRSKGGELGFFGPGLMAKPFEEAAFALKPGEISAPVRTRFGWHLIQVEEVQEPEVIPLERARADIARELAVADAARQLADRMASAALSAARAGKSLTQLYPPTGKEAGAKAGARLGGQAVVAQETGPFGPGGGDYVPGLGSVPGLAADAFKYEAGKLLPRAYESPAGPVVAQVKTRQRPDPARFAERGDEMARRLRGQRELQVESAWLKGLREKSKVEINEAFLRGDVGPSRVDLE
jgi:peptidyl-prolyl cis-trans isomerase D